MSYSQSAGYLQSKEVHHHTMWGQHFDTIPPPSLAATYVEYVVQQVNSTSLHISGTEIIVPFPLAPIIHIFSTFWRGSVKTLTHLKPYLKCFWGSGWSTWTDMSHHKTNKQLLKIIKFRYFLFAMATDMTFSKHADKHLYIQSNIVYLSGKGTVQFLV